MVIEEDNKPEEEKPKRRYTYLKKTKKKKRKVKKKLGRKRKPGPKPKKYKPKKKPVGRPKSRRDPNSLKSKAIRRRYRRNRSKVLRRLRMRIDPEYKAKMIAKYKSRFDMVKYKNQPEIYNKLLKQRMEQRYQENKDMIEEYKQILYRAYNTEDYHNKDKSFYIGYRVILWAFKKVNKEHFDLYDMEDEITSCFFKCLGRYYEAMPNIPVRTYLNKIFPYHIVDEILKMRRNGNGMVQHLILATPRIDVAFPDNLSLLFSMLPENEKNNRLRHIQQIFKQKEYRISTFMKHKSNNALLN